MLWSECRQNKIKKIWIVTIKTESFPLTLSFVMQCNMQRCRCTVGYKTISYSLYVLMDPFFTFCVILSLGACS